MSHFEVRIEEGPSWPLVVRAVGDVEASSIRVLDVSHRGSPSDRPGCVRSMAETLGGKFGRSGAAFALSFLWLTSPTRPLNRVAALRAAARPPLAGTGWTGPESYNDDARVVDWTRTNGGDQRLGAIDVDSHCAARIFDSIADQAVISCGLVRPTGDTPVSLEELAGVRPRDGRDLEAALMKRGSRTHVLVRSFGAFDDPEFGSNFIGPTRMVEALRDVVEDHRLEGLP